MNPKLERFVGLYRSASHAIIRLIGCCFVLVGIVVFLWFAYLFHKPGSTIRWFGESTTDLWPKVITLAMPLIVAGLGALLVMAKKDLRKR